MLAMTSRRTWRGLGAVLLGASLWPAAAGCTQDMAGRLGGGRTVTYFIAPESAEASSRPGDAELAVWALESWARLLDPDLRLEPGPEESASVRIYWIPAGFGLYGEMRAREVDGLPAADVFVHPDTDALGADIALAARADPLFRDTVVFLTCVHELGHAFGLDHTASFADIMYSFVYGGDFRAYFMRFRDQLDRREDVRDSSPFSASDMEAFRALYR
jgi:hypothetical protein